MKKLLSLSAAILIAVTAAAPVFADDSAKVYVTISDANGQLVMTQEEITVTDLDGDGALTINDTLIAAHDAEFEGGAEAGYNAAESEYGMSIYKLWGTENGGSYGYYLNNASAWSPTDPVKDGDYLNAFVYTDLTAWSDTYCYFDANTIEAEAGSEITLTLSAAGYDADYNPVTLPVADASITVNGEATDVKTDADGKAVITLDAGSYVISAASDTQTLVPPVCTAAVSDGGLTVEAPVISETEPEASLAPQTGCIGAAAAVMTISSLAALALSKKKTYEK